MDVKCVIGTDEGDNVFEMTASTFFDRLVEEFFGAALAVLFVGFLTPEGGAGHCLAVLCATAGAASDVGFQIL